MLLGHIRGKGYPLRNGRLWLLLDGGSAFCVKLITMWCPCGGTEAESDESTGEK